MFMALETSLVVLFYCCASADILTKLLQQCFTPFTQILPTRVCFTNAGINNNNIYGGKNCKVSISSYLDEVSHS